jgi:hypothetical protein
MLALAELTNVIMVIGIIGKHLDGKTGKPHNCDASSTLMTR